MVDPIEIFVGVRADGRRALGYQAPAGDYERFESVLVTPVEGDSPPSLPSQPLSFEEFQDWIGEMTARGHSVAYSPDAAPQSSEAREGVMDNGEVQMMFGTGHRVTADCGPGGVDADCDCFVVYRSDGAKLRESVTWPTVLRVIKGDSAKTQPTSEVSRIDASLTPPVSA
jgi:hypothetical protein